MKRGKTERKVKRQKGEEKKIKGKGKLKMR